MIWTGEINGHEAVYLENETLRVAVLPRKGADICALVHKPSAVDFLMHTPAGLAPPGAQPQADFLENYEGGWQVLFPSGDAACTYRDQTIPFHGEVALLRWDYRVEQDDEAGSQLHLTVRCRRTPWQIDRTLWLAAGSSELVITQRASNLSEEPLEFVWGEHLVLGGDFLEDGCRLDAPAAWVLTPDQIYEPATARLAAGQHEPWPLARGRQPGQRWDLSRIPGRQAHSHDDAFLADLSAGCYTVTNPRLGLAFTLAWDVAIFPYVTFWMPYGGADLPPLTGIYGLGLEPWTSRYNLEGAVAQGEARAVEGHGSLETTIRATIGAGGIHQESTNERIAG